MRLSTKGRYAVTAMLDLALNEHKGPVTLADISESQGISLSYLEQLFAALRGKQLVRGVRGPGGGYYLARPSDEISIADIICAVDEWVELTRGGVRENHRDRRQSLTHALWDQLSDEIFGFLRDISLADLINEGNPDGLVGAESSDHHLGDLERQEDGQDHAERAHTCLALARATGRALRSWE